MRPPSGRYLFPPGLPNLVSLIILSFLHNLRRSQAIFQRRRCLLVSTLSILLALPVTGNGMLQNITISKLHVLFPDEVNPLGVDECCPFKKIGAVSYLLMKYDLETASNRGCDSGCLYSTNSFPNTEFCFRAGELPSCSESPFPNPTHDATDSPTSLATEAPRPVDGMWGEWGGWNSCSEPCGEGNRTRGRACVPPVFGGLDCQGEATQTETCNITSCPVLSCPAAESTTSTPSSLTDFFDYAMTNFNETINVTCCGLDGREVTASCGLGLGCSAVCSSLSSTLCPSGDCNDCHSIVESSKIQKRKKKSSCTASSDASCLNRCERNGCRVGRGSEHCCFHPSCRNKRKKKCSWLQKYTGDSCPKPGNIPRGEWICPEKNKQFTEATEAAEVVQDTQVSSNATSDGLPVSRQELQCHLECQPGFVPNLPPSISCVRGKFEPAKPSSFLCEQAALLLLSKENELEVFNPKNSRKCNKKLKNSPPSGGNGMSISLFKSHLVIAGFQTEDGSWRYNTLSNPRSSLLAAAWNTTKTIGEEAPTFHTSYTFARSLVLIRGDAKPPLKLDMDRVGNKDGSWVRIEYKNETSSANNILTPCGIKTDLKTFMTFGGSMQVDGEVVATVLVYNLETEEIKELPPMKFSRVDHACSLIDQRRVLITGGRDKLGNIVQDEVYDLVLQFSNINISSMATPRYDHSMALLGETIFALGGRDASGTELQSVEKFNSTTGSWEPHPESLLSSATAGLAHTLFPQSALDCDVGCQCGNRQVQRIIGGVEVKVRSLLYHVTTVFQNHSFPWLALLLVGDQEPIDSSCSATLVGTLHITSPPRLAQTGPSQLLTVSMMTTLRQLCQPTPSP